MINRAPTMWTTARSGQMDDILADGGRRHTHDGFVA